jgi:hypothetical protein
VLRQPLEGFVEQREVGGVARRRAVRIGQDIPALLGAGQSFDTGERVGVPGIELERGEIRVDRGLAVDALSRLGDLELQRELALAVVGDLHLAAQHIEQLRVLLAAPVNLRHGLERRDRPLVTVEHGFVGPQRGFVVAAVALLDFADLHEDLGALPGVLLRISGALSQLDGLGPVLDLAVEHRQLSKSRRVVGIDRERRLEVFDRALRVIEKMRGDVAELAQGGEARFLVTCERSHPLQRGRQLLVALGAPVQVGERRTRSQVLGRVPRRRLERIFGVFVLAARHREGAGRTLERCSGARASPLVRQRKIARRERLAIALAALKTRDIGQPANVVVALQGLLPQLHGSVDVVSARLRNR